MPHVITQSCCNDSACTEVCPVDCIHPSPTESAYKNTDMLFIDPAICIDCGVCISECPVDAIYQDHDLPEHLRFFAHINAEFFKDNPANGVVPERTVIPRDLSGKAPLRIAIIGSGPSGCYTAMELLGVNGTGVKIDIFDRLPTPWGLVRYGVAPDHQSTKSVTSTFSEYLNNPRLRFLLNIEIGVDITVTELHKYYHAVIYAFGSSSSRSLCIKGESLRGSVSATKFVGWYNGHPDLVDYQYDTNGKLVAIIGNGNVALDIARIIVSDRKSLHASDIAQPAFDALVNSSVREVTIIGRRGITSAACTLPELLALGQLPNVDIIVREEDLSLTSRQEKELENSVTARLKYEAFCEFAKRVNVASNKRISFRFNEAPIEFVGREHIEAVVLEKNLMRDEGDSVKLFSTGKTLTLKSDLVIRSVGYAGKELQGLPFDHKKAILPNASGRVVDPKTGRSIVGVYTVGWIKRGPSGVIGSNKLCASETVDALINDANDNCFKEPPCGSYDLDELIESRHLKLITWDQWKKIDCAEISKGSELNRPRVKLTSTEEMLLVATSKESISGT